MPKQNPLLNIVKKQKEGKAVAIYSLKLRWKPQKNKIHVF